MVHEHPGVYSSYDASSVIGGKKTARILGAAAVSTTGTATEVVTLTSYGEGVSFYELDDFSVVVCRPGKRIIYSHCRWSNIEELGKLGEPVAEKVTVISCKRMETDA